jgi:hypothetical protein
MQGDDPERMSFQYGRPVGLVPTVAGVRPDPLKGLDEALVSFTHQGQKLLISSLDISGKALLESTSLSVQPLRMY